MILVQAGTTRQRRRFTVAHELGRFLSPWHGTTVAGGFACTPQDLSAPWQVPSKGSRHQIQESEANRFAIELLAHSA
jgi:Zn-dependent peptidase ImmA (M78 family)